MSEPDESAESSPGSRGRNTNSEEKLREGGFNAGGSRTGEVLRNVKPVHGKIKFLIWSGSVVAGVIFLMAAIIIAGGVAELAGGSFDTKANPGIALLYLVPSFLIAASYQISLLAPGRQVVLKGARYGDLTSMLNEAATRAPKVLGTILTIALIQAVCFFLPGIVLAALSPAAYLAATRPQLSIFEIVIESLGWTKRHFLTLVGSSVCFYVLSALLFVALISGTLALGSLGSVAGAYEISGWELVMLVVLAVPFIFQVLQFVFYGTLFFTLDSVETGFSIH